MKLLHETAKLRCEFEENCVGVWSIESKALYFQLIQELKGQAEGNEGGFQCFDGNKPLKIKDAVCLITDYFSIDANNKRIQQKVLKKLLLIANETVYDKTIEFQSAVRTYLENLLEYTDLDIVYGDEIDINGILKLFDLHIEIEGDGLAGYLLSFMKLCMKLDICKCFVLANLKQYLDTDEIEELYKCICYEKIPVLLIENQTREKNLYEKVLILDQDYCVI